MSHPYGNALAAIPTGSVALDEALAQGGYPRGCIIDLGGGDASGKTTLALHAVASAQHRGGVCVFIDADASLDLGHARRIGVDLGRLLLARPTCAEEGLGIAARLARLPQIALIVVDSATALLPRSQVEGQRRALRPPGFSRAMGREWRTLAELVRQSNTTLLCTRAVSPDGTELSGRPTSAVAGPALRFYAGVRLHVRAVGNVVERGRVSGTRLRVQVLRNTPSGRPSEAEFELGWDLAIDKTRSPDAKGTRNLPGSGVAPLPTPVGVC